MKAEIDVELPEHIAAEWDAVAVRKPVAGEYVLSSKTEYVHVLCVLSARDEDNIPRIILRRKDNPRDWWPTWLTANLITFTQSGIIVVDSFDRVTTTWFHQDTPLFDCSWVPEHLKHSGRTIENPWKAKVQE